MLSNTKLGVKSKTKKLINPLWHTVSGMLHAVFVSLLQKKKMLHKGKKGNKDDQKLRHCYSI